MPVLMIAYDLHTPNKDYTPFFQAIQNNAKTWWHYLTNAWLVNTDLNETQFAQNLYPHMTKLDRLLVMEAKGIGDGWLASDAWEWIRNQQQPQVSFRDYLKKTTVSPPPAAKGPTLADLLKTPPSQPTYPVSLWDMLKKDKK